MPVANYAPELLQLLIHAAEAPVRIPLASKAQATSLRFRLHNLRKEMRKENHPNLRIVEGVQISLEEAVLIARPSDETFLEAIRAAGITVEEMDDNYSHTMAEPLPDTQEEAEAALAEFFKEE